jgi:hypothetical protein
MDFWLWIGPVPAKFKGAGKMPALQRTKATALGTGAKQVSRTLMGRVAVIA